MTTIPIDLKKRLWTYDLLHGGNLFARIRNERGISQEEIARCCSVGVPSISRFEKGGQPERLDGYIQALQSDEFESPLTNIESSVLKDLYLSSRQQERENLQNTLSWVRFSDILSGRYSDLSTLAQHLTHINQPAFIMDPSLSVHAMNGAVLRLFNINPEYDKAHLHRWEFWNNLSCKFYPGSRIYAAHTNRDMYFPQTIAALFQSEQARKYWFTWQMRVLVCRLRSMASQVNFPFARVWNMATSFSHPFGLQQVNRSLAYAFTPDKKQTIYAEANFMSSCPVKMATGLTVNYVLGVWKPTSAEARQAFAHIQHDPNCKTVYYAANYDTSPASFHVNTWPEVQVVLR